MTVIEFALNNNISLTYYETVLLDSIACRWAYSRTDIETDLVETTIEDGGFTRTIYVHDFHPIDEEQDIELRDYFCELLA